MQSFPKPASIPLKWTTAASQPIAYLQQPKTYPNYLLSLPIFDEKGYIRFPSAKYSLLKHVDRWEVSKIEHLSEANVTSNDVNFFNQTPRIELFEVGIYSNDGAYDEESCNEVDEEET